MGRRSRDKTQLYIPKVYIREFRQERDKRLSDLVDDLRALGIDITEASLSRMERSLQPIDTRILAAIAKALGTTTTALLTNIRPDDDHILHTWARIPERLRAPHRDLLEAAAEQGDKDKASVKPAAKRARAHKSKP